MNPDYSLVTNEERTKVKCLRAELITDTLLTGIRSGAISFLVFELVPTSIFWKYSLAGLSGLMSAIHSSYIRYSASVSKSALSFITEEELIHRKNSLESSALLLKQEIKITTKTKMESASRLFDNIAVKYKSKGMERAIDVVNIMARMARFIGFFLFVAVFNEIFNLGLGAGSVIALTFLWGAEVFKSDGAIFKESLQANWTGIAARAHIEKTKNQRDIINHSKSWTCFSGAFFNYGKALVKSPYDYSLEDLEDAAETLKHN